MPNRLYLLARNLAPKAVFEFVTGHRRDVLFFWVPKAAGTSIYNVLLKYGCPKHRWLKLTRPFPNKGFMTFGHVDVPSVIEAGIMSEQYVQRAFKFGFVRNPFDRLVSLFFHYKKVKWPDVPESMTFDEFCSRVTTQGIKPVGLYNDVELNRCNPQVAWLLDKNGHQLVDFIGKYETLNADFDRVCQTIGIPAQQIPHENKTQHAPYRDYYNAGTRSMVAEFYKKDLETFDYAF
jgi:hypothetical protein